MFSLRSTQAHSGRMGAVAGPLCLVAEDEALIAMGLAADCDDAGLEIVGPFASCAQALDWVEEHTPDIALLDVETQGWTLHRAGPDPGAAGRARGDLFRAAPR